MWPLRLGDVASLTGGHNPSEFRARNGSEMAKIELKFLPLYCTSVLGQMVEGELTGMMGLIVKLVEFGVRYESAE